MRGYTGDRSAPNRIAHDTLLYSYRDRVMLGFSEAMAMPLSFLDAFLG